VVIAPRRVGERRQSCISRRAFPMADTYLFNTLNRYIHLQQFAEKFTPFKGSYQPSAFSTSVLAEG
jgi:hypothetical protein